MKDQLQFICNNCGLIFDQLHGRNTINRNKAKYIQVLVDEIQSALDDISNELQRAELDQEDDDFDRRHAYPICDDYDL